MGPAGPAGAPGGADLDTVRLVQRLSAEVENLQGELKIQFTRIAQLQAELDKLRAGARKSN